jgi:lactate oxidase
MRRGFAAAPRPCEHRHMPQASLPAGQDDAAPPPPYQGGSAVRKLAIVNLSDLEAEAKEILPPGGFGYIASGSGDEWTLRENLAAFQRIPIEPRYLSGITDPDLSATILGTTLPFPVIIPPMGSHGLAHVSREEGTAKGAAAAGTLMIAATPSNLSMEEIAAAAAGPKWFQLYFPADLGFARELLQHARATGYTAIVVTADTVWASPRETNLRNRFKLPRALGRGNAPLGKTRAEANAALDNKKKDLNWDDIAFVQKESGLPVIIKGVLSPAMAATAVARGAAAVYVSNHGGRALVGAPASIAVLPRIAEAVDGRVPIILDGGVRRGVDIFRARALGADIVAVGRPVLYGLALGGWMGVQSVLEYLKEDLALTMKLAGTQDLRAITKDYLSPMF